MSFYWARPVAGNAAPPHRLPLPLPLLLVHAPDPLWSLLAQPAEEKRALRFSSGLLRPPPSLLSTPTYAGLAAEEETEEKGAKQ